MLLYEKSSVNEKSIGELADIAGIKPTTTFFCRHKIMDTLQTYVDVKHVEAVVKIDEFF